MLDSVDRAHVSYLTSGTRDPFRIDKSEGSLLNAFMQIQVRVAAGQAAATLRALGTSINGLNGHLDETSRRSRRSSRDLVAWGNQLQWTGRQIQTNWTLPLLAAGAAAVHMQLENEKAFTRIEKVYGSAALSASVMKEELEALEKAFQALSDRFGVAQSEVLQIAGDWAAAGASGKAMFTAVQTTLEAMILGEIKAADATKALIAIQAQYGTDAAGLAKIIGTLNSVENETGVSMAGLIQGFSRSAGVARQAGVDYRHLAAMIAALSPAAGSATEAGNALKTIFSRLASPTRETTQVLGLMGISMDDMNWKSATATEQLQILSKSFEGLSDKQKEVVSTVIASRWQINKFSILMRELSSENGYYQKALNATSNSSKVFTQYQRELNAVLSSNPQRMQQIWVMLQNAGTDIVQPLIPMLLYLANSVRVIVTAFSNLDPALQKFIILMTLAVFATGPLLRYIGSLVTLVVEFGRVLLFLLTPLTWIPVALGAMATAVTATFAALLAAISSVMVTGGRLLLLGWTLLLRQFPAAVAAVRGVWAAVWGATWFLLHTVGMVIWTQMLAAWALVQTQFRAIMVAGMGVARLLWVALLGGFPVLMMTVGALIGTAWATVMARIGAITAVAGRAISVIYRNGLLLLAAVQLVVGRAIQAAFAGMMFGIAAISSVVWPVVQRIWYAAYAGLYVVVNAGQAALLVMYRSTQLGFSAITVATGYLIHQAWYAIQLGMQYILLAAQTVMHAMWRLYMFGLAPITAAAGRMIHAIWAATLRGMALIMTAMRPVFAAGWAAWALIARLGSMAIAFATTYGRMGIALLATAPMRMVALFRAGFMALVAVARGGVVGLVKLLIAGLSAIGWPVVLAIAAAVLLIAGFWDEIKAGFNNVVKFFSSSGNSLAVAVRNVFGSIGRMMTRVFNMLPESVQNAMIAVAKIIATAARKIYDLFSYINPFARHSPSLVENVTNGMAIVGQQFKGTFSNVEKSVKSAYATLQKFGGVASAMGVRQQEAEWSDQRKNLRKARPSALPAFDALTSQVRALTPILNQLESAVRRQQSVVDAWSDRLEAANSALDKQQKRLDELKDHASKLNQELDAARQRLADWSNTPIKGQRAMSDAIFENQQSSKALQLQLLKMEQAGTSLGDIQSRMSAINGEIDVLRGLRKDLAQGGAGSDILAVYDKQISDLQGQGGGLSGQAKAIQDLQKELDELDKKGQILDLENSLKFDGLTRQIQQASESMKEMPFSTIMKGIADSKAEVDKLSEAYDKANKAVENQQKIVDAATAARDAIQARYDAEQKKLERLKDAYDSVNSAIQDINSSLQQMTQYADDAISRAQKKAGKKKGRGGADTLSPGAQNFIDAEGGNFPDVGGDLQIGREGGLGSQAVDIDKMTQDLAKQTSGMFAGLNPLDPLKRWWDRAWEWLRKYIGPLFTGLGDLISAAFSGIPNPFGDGMGNWTKSIESWIDPTLEMFKSFGRTILNVFGSIWTFLTDAWEFVQPLLEDLWDGLVEGLTAAWDQIRPELAKFKDLLKPIGEAFSNLWTMLKPLLAIIGGALVAVFMLIVDIAKNVIGPILETIGGVIAGVIRIIRGVIEFIVGVFTADWKMAWRGITDIFGGAWDIIADIVVGGWKIVLGFLKGVMQWLGQIFGLVWDKAVVPAWNAAWGYISRKAVDAWNAITKPFKDAYNWVADSLSKRWEIIKSEWPKAWASIRNSAVQRWNEIIKPLKDGYNWIRDTLSDAFSVVVRKFKDHWKGLSEWFEGTKNWLSDPIKGSINLVISAVNLLIKGLNKLADVLPGFDWSISLIPKLAQGGAIPGRRVGSGFVTNGARAIVGEGNPVHPEFVVPTDPMYRKRALALYGMLGRKLGAPQSFMGGVPAYASGGILGTIGDALGGAGSFFKGLGSDIMSHISDGVASYVVDPFFDMAQPFIEKVNWNMATAIWGTARSKVKEWLTFADDAAKRKYEDGGAAAVPAGKIRDWITKALSIIKEPMTLAKGIYNIIMHESGGNPRAINNWDSNAKAGIPSKGLMQTIDPTFNAYSIKGHKDIWNPIDNIIAGTRYAISRYGRKWLAAGGNRDKNGNYIGYAAGGILPGKISVPSLADGAYIRRRVGGTLVRVGEGRTDEAVVPLPRGADSFGESKVYNFYGDLSFPNITSADDAQTFLDNLDNLAG